MMIEGYRLKSFKDDVRHCFINQKVNMADKIRFIDPWFWGAVISLSLIGFVMVSSASLEIGEQRYDDLFFFVKRHAAYLLIGSVLCLFILRFPMQLWQEQSWLLLGGSFFLLVLVLVPGIGREFNGSMRWLGVGSMTLQPSELVKLFAMVYLSAYLVRHQEEVRQKWSGLMKPISVIGLLMVLLLLEPDFGAVVVLLGASFGMMFLGGVKAGQFFLLLTVSGSVMIVTAFMQPYRMKRLTTFTNPWSEENVFDGGYQLTQSLIAFGRGEWFGVGLGNSIQKLFYLPESYTDFVFAIIAEEHGLIGALTVIGLFVLFIYRCFRIGRMAEAKDAFFSAYLTYGITLLFAAQVMINIGVNTGMLPTKGLTLPFLSYGGTSLLVSFMAVGILQRVYYETLKLPEKKIDS